MAHPARKITAKDASAKLAQRRLTVLDQPSGLVVIGHEYVADKADYVRIQDDLPACAGDFRAPAKKAP